MKAILIVVALCATAAAKPDPRLHIQVDKRIEVFSILQRLAGATPYTRAVKSPYTDAVDAHFGPFRDHAAVKLTIALRAKYGISYNAPLTLAVQLDDSLKALVPLTPLPDGLDPRFKDAPITEYLDAVRDFAAKTDLDGFLRSQQPYITKVEQRFADFLADKPLIAWFDALFGKRAKASYFIVPALLTGPYNFGLHAVRKDGSEVVVQAMFLEAVDGEGLPKIGELTHGLLAHELAHTYVNPVMEAHVAVVAPAFDPAYATVHDAMAKQAYPTAAIVLDESVVRAITVLYLRDAAGAEAAARSLAEQQKLSFVWTPELVAALDAARKSHHGRLSDAQLVAAAAQGFAAWDAAHPPH